MIKVSAPGKVHLIGEHAVVYGQPAIIASIARRTQVKAERHKKIKIKDNFYKKKASFEIDDVLSTTQRIESLWKSGFEKNNFSELFTFMKASHWNLFKAMIGMSFKSFKIKGGISLITDTTLLPGSGLGSSASLAVSVVMAIASVYRIRVSKKRVNELAFLIERFNHGNPSGGDNSACCFGGLIWFKKGNIKSLLKEIPYELENFVMVSTKKPTLTTGELVQKVRNLDPDFRNRRIEAIGKATYKMRKALKNKDFNKVKGLILTAQKNLAEIGVSSPEINKIVSKVRKIGGAAKLCGAGGGGNVLCYHENKEKLLKVIGELGFSPWEVKLGVEGVKIED